MRRRHVLLAASAISVSAGAQALGVRPAWAGLPRQPVRGRSGRRVAVLGGGIGGLSAAHELAERGFDVTVFERKTVPGGKARSMGARGTGTQGRPDLPGEHGFRFFPGFYRHLPETMARIPFRRAGSRARTVADNLVTASRLHMAQAGKSDVLLPLSLPDNLDDVGAALAALFGAPSLGLDPRDLAHFASRLHVFLTSSDERRFGELEGRSWWDFVGAASRGAAYQKLLATGLTRNLVAARADLLSARTCAAIVLQLLSGFTGRGNPTDRVLAGPTNDVFIEPWLAYLRGCGVDYRMDARVVDFEFDGARIEGAIVAEAGVIRVIEADYYVAAMPVEVMAPLVTDAMKTRDPRLARLSDLHTEWMNGAQLYFDRDVKIVHGHSNYYDSPWALTSISQPQFWPSFDLGGYGDGRVRGVLSVDVSNWDAPGVIYGKPARACTPDEIRDEIVEQLRLHFDAAALAEFDAATLLHFHLDPSITYAAGPPGAPVSAANDEPLLVNTAGSWRSRPDAATAIPNLFLAADYVRTFSDLATMEGANEAARRAVNGILAASGSPASRCAVLPLAEPSAFALSRAHDRVRYALGLPNVYAPFG